MTKLKKLKIIDKEAHKKSIENLKKSVVYVPIVTIEKDKVWFRIGNKKTCLSIEKTVKLYNSSHIEIAQRFEKKFGVKVNPRKTRKVIFKVLPSKPIILTTDEGKKLIRFIAESSDGHYAQKTGFFIKTKDNFIVSELTIFRGEEEVTIITDKDDITTSRITIRPVLFYNRKGERDYFDPREDILNFNGKSIYLEGKTELSTTLHTLMTYETAQRFLNGETVTIKEVYPKLIAKFRKFVNCEWDTRIYDVLACYATATHFFDVFKVFGILYLFGVFESGKGRAGKCVVFASHRGINILSPSDASFYRMVDALRPTILFEEINDLWKRPMFQELWRGSYKKGSRVPRIGKSKNEIMFLILFEEFCPTIATSTQRITGKERRATESRTIHITMRRASDPNPEKQDPEETDFDEERNDLYLSRLTQAKQVSDIAEQLNNSPAIQQTFKGRSWEIWRPLLTVAKLTSEQVFNSVLSFAKESIAERKSETYDKEQKIISVIDSLFQNNATKVTFTPKKLSELMFEKYKEDFGFKDYGNEEFTLKSLIEAKRKFNENYSPEKLGHILKRMDLKRKRALKGTEYTITLAILSDLKSQFGYMEPPEDSTEDTVEEVEVNV